MVVYISCFLSFPNPLVFRYMHLDWLVLQIIVHYNQSLTIICFILIFLISTPSKFPSPIFLLLRCPFECTDVCLYIYIYTSKICHTPLYAFLIYRNGILLWSSLLFIFFFIKYSQKHVLEDLLVLLRVSCVRAFNTSPFTFASPVPLGIGRWVVSNPFHLKEWCNKCRNTFFTNQYK